MQYFAYGSNMLNRRLRLRVPSADVITPARLAGYQLRFHKKSNTDGSAKCSLAEKRDSVAYGVIFEIDPAEKKLLDQAEGLGFGYRDLQITLNPVNYCHEDRSSQNGSGLLTAYTYLAMESHIDDSLKPFRWYKQLVLKGAEQHHLPEKYIQMIRETAALPDPDRKRRQHARNILTHS